MERAPRNAGAGVFTRSVVTLMLVGGAWSTAANLTLFAWALESGRSVTEAMSMTFLSLVLIEFAKAYNYRSDHHSVFHRPFANKWLNLAILWETGLLVFILWFEPLHEPFGTCHLTRADWFIAAIPALSLSPVLDLAKRFVSRWQSPRFQAAAG